VICTPLELVESERCAVRPIIDEIHAIRDALARASGNDLQKIAEAARSRAEGERTTGREAAAETRKDGQERFLSGGRALVVASNRSFLIHAEGTVRSPYLRVSEARALLDQLRLAKLAGELRPRPLAKSAVASGTAAQRAQGRRTPGRDGQLRPGPRPSRDRARATGAEG